MCLIHHGHVCYVRCLSPRSRGRHPPGWGGEGLGYGLGDDSARLIIKVANFRTK